VPAEEGVGVVEAAADPKAAAGAVPAGVPGPDAVLAEEAVVPGVTGVALGSSAWAMVGPIPIPIPRQRQRQRQRQRPVSKGRRVVMEKSP
jgi:hypothetical protein